MVATGKRPRRERVRLALAVAVIPSLVVHLAFLVAVTLSLRRARHVVSVQPIDLLEVHGHPAPPAPKPRPSRPRPPHRIAHAKVKRPPPSRPLHDVVAFRHHPAHPHPAHKPEARRPTPPPPASQPTDGALASELDHYAPSSARLVVLLRTDRIRRTPYRASVERLLQVLPDYWSLLGSTGESALATFDSLLIATANPLYVDQTFLAARYHGSEQAVRDLLDQGAGGTIRWQTYRGVPLGRRPPGLFDDPRVLLAPLPGLMVLTRPEFVDGLLDGMPPSTAPASPPTPAPTSQPVTWLERLAALEKASGTGDDGPLVLVTATDLPGLLALEDTGEVPATLSIGLRDPDPLLPDPDAAPPDPASRPAGDPAGPPAATAAPSYTPPDPVVLDALLGFHTTTDASAFASATWPLLRAAIEEQPLARLVAGDLAQLDPQVEGLNVRFHAEVPGAHVLLLLTVIRSALPAPPNMPHSAPPPLRTLPSRR